MKLAKNSLSVQNILLCLSLHWMVLSLSTVEALGISSPSSIQGDEESVENPSVTRFREYLRLKAIHPEPDYNSSIAWIKNQAEEIGLEFRVVQFEPPYQFAVILKWPGANRTLKSILLNSHIDVVPVEIEKWAHDPFGADKDENGNIYARGAQDMKSVGVQYLEAIRRLKARSFTPLRTVYITFSPDEELGGKRGMKHFVNQPEFQELNVGFGLDEGTASPDHRFFLMWTERVIWQTEFIALGQAGHGSILHNNTAAEKISKVIDLMLEIRQGEKDRMEKENLDLGDVTSINLTILKGGTQVNVVPSEFSATFDIRIAPYWNFSHVENLLENVARQAGPNVTCNYLRKSDIIAQTPLTPDNVWWQAVQNFANESNVEFYPTIMPGGTDIKYLREKGIPAFGFSPMNKTPKLAHDHDEFLNEQVFLRGIQIYEQLLPKFFNMTGTD